MPASETIKAPEFPADPEVLSSAELWINNVANHPAKLVTMLILAKAHGPFTETPLYTEIKNHCAGPTAYGRSSFFNYCAQLEKAGAVQRTEIPAVRGRGLVNADAVEATPEGRHYGFALAGLLLDWQIAHPEIPLQTLLGGSQSSKNTAFAPTIRTLMLDDLIAENDNPRGPSIDHLPSVGDFSSTARGNTVEKMVYEGWATSKSQMEKNERNFVITDPDYHRRTWNSKSFEGLKPEAQLIYRALRKAKEVKDEWEVDEFLQFCAELGDVTDPDLMKKIRTRLGNGLSPSGTNFKGNIAAAPGTKYQSMSIVKLKPEFLEPIRELVESINGFAGKDPRVIEKGIGQAELIYSSPELIGWLLSYAYDSSSYTNQDSRKEQRIVEIVDTNPGVSTADVHQRYREMRKKRLSKAMVQEVLAQAAQATQPKVTHEAVRVTNIKDLKIRRHLPATEKDNAELTSISRG